MNAPEDEPDGVPDSMPDSVPDSTPDGVRDAMPESVPDSMPRSVPDSSLESVPDSMPGAPPEPGAPPPWPRPDPAPEPEVTPPAEPEPEADPGAPGSGPASLVRSTGRPPSNGSPQPAAPASKPTTPAGSTEPAPGADGDLLARSRSAIPAGLGTVLFGAGGVALLGAAQLLALRRSSDPTLHAPLPLVAQVAGIGLLWVVASVGLVRRAPWGRVLAAFLGLADLAQTAAQASALAGLPAMSGPPWHRAGIDLLCAALALPWFAPAFRGPGSGPSIGKAYPAAVAWGTVLFLALAMAPGFSALAKVVGMEGTLAESPLFAGATVLRSSPAVAALVLPLLVLGPLLLVEVRSRWAAIVVHLVGAATSMFLLNDLASAARELTRRAR